MVLVSLSLTEGGPPARGGGNTHEFYASMGKRIQADDIQLTIQDKPLAPILVQTIPVNTI